MNATQGPFELGCIRFVRHWADLAAVPESKTHVLEIDVEECNGWIHEKGADPHKLGIYLSTHTFYGSTYAESTRILQRCGFNVELANWDAEPNVQAHTRAGAQDSAETTDYLPKNEL